MSTELKVAIEAAKKGAKQALQYYGKSIEIKLKEDKSVFTIADKESENAIKKCILSYFPTAKFVAEESRNNGIEKEFWIVDPIDGSRNFSRGIPIWAVLVALYKNGKVILGVCYYPLLDLLLYAQEGEGTFYNGKRIHVSSINAVKDTYISFGSPRHFRNKQILIKLIEKSAAVRCPDASYSASLLAMGKIDVLIDEYGMIWDIAPFKVIIEEAGGKVTNWKGDPWAINNKGCVATNGILHDEVMKIINNTVSS